MDACSARSEWTPPTWWCTGAVYLHQGDSYLCDDDGSDVEAGEVMVRPARLGYLTQPVVDTGALSGSARTGATIGPAAGVRTTRVRSRVTGFCDATS